MTPHPIRSLGLGRLRGSLHPVRPVLSEGEEEGEDEREADRQTDSELTYFCFLGADNNSAPLGPIRFTYVFFFGLFLMATRND